MGSIAFPDERRGEIEDKKITRKGEGLRRWRLWCRIPVYPDNPSKGLFFQVSASPRFEAIVFLRSLFTARDRMFYNNAGFKHAEK